MCVCVCVCVRDDRAETHMARKMGIRGQGKETSSAMRWMVRRSKKESELGNSILSLFESTNSNIAQGNPLVSSSSVFKGTLYKVVTCGAIVCCAGTHAMIQ